MKLRTLSLPSWSYDCHNHNHDNQRPYDHQIPSHLSALLPLLDSFLDTDYLPVLKGHQGLHLRMWYYDDMINMSIFDNMVVCLCHIRKMWCYAKCNVTTWRPSGVDSSNSSLSCARLVGLLIRKYSNIQKNIQKIFKLRNTRLVGLLIRKYSNIHGWPVGMGIP